MQLVYELQVEELDLSGNFLEDDSCKVVAGMLQRNTFICRVNLGKNKISHGFGAFHKVRMQHFFVTEEVSVTFIYKIRVNLSEFSFNFRVMKK